MNAGIALRKVTDRHAMVAVLFGVGDQVVQVSLATVMSPPRAGRLVSKAERHVESSPITHCNGSP